jgi:hypothetical protein
MEEIINNVPEDFKAVVEKALSQGKKISMITHVIGDVGEAKLKYIIYKVINKYNREDLMELLYTAAKELIVNSTKAAIKRMIFQEMGLNINDPEEYSKGMEQFKGQLNDRKFPFYRKRMKTNKYFIKITFTYTEKLITLSIINNFPLLRIEEDRIREKLQAAKKFDNLFEFFMEHGDNTEGAGMGITMVEILLSQSGFDRNLFSIYSSSQQMETTAKVDLPITEESKATHVGQSEQLVVA